MNHNEFVDFSPIEAHDALIYVVYLEGAKEYDVVLCDTEELAESVVKAFARKCYLESKLGGMKSEPKEGQDLVEFMNKEGEITTHIFEKFVVTKDGVNCDILGSSEEIDEGEFEKDGDDDTKLLESMESCNHTMEDPCV